MPLTDVETSDAFRHQEQQHDVSVKRRNSENTQNRQKIKSDDWKERDTVDTNVSLVQRCNRSPMLTRIVPSIGVAGINPFPLLTTCIFGKKTILKRLIDFAKLMRHPWNARKNCYLKSSNLVLE